MSESDSHFADVVVPRNYEADVLHNCAPAACKCIGVMGVVAAIFVIAAISTGHNQITINLASVPKRKSRVNVIINTRWSLMRSSSQPPETD